MSTYVAIACDRQVDDGGQPRACPQVWYGPRRVIHRILVIEDAPVGWTINPETDTAYCPEHAP